MGSEFVIYAVSHGKFLGFLILAFSLLIGHMLGDYPLQGEFLATGKNRHLNATNLFEGNTPPRHLWVHALTAHSLIHAGIVWAITSSAAFGIAELVLHWIIDFCRCEKLFSFNIDQALHVLCKLIYATLIVSKLV